jgi:hypothetical protein
VNDKDKDATIVININGSIASQEETEAVIIAALNRAHERGVMPRYPRQTPAPQPPPLTIFGWVKGALSRWRCP